MLRNLDTARYQIDPKIPKQTKPSICSHLQSGNQTPDQQRTTRPPVTALNVAAATLPQGRMSVFNALYSNPLKATYRVPGNQRHTTHYTECFGSTQGPLVYDNGTNLPFYNQICFGTDLLVFQQTTDNLTKPNQRLPFNYQ
ncbi:hypothetical protein LOTGIDRAFT_155087 [Lottia gigantea]|uniref:Uncharacterized protein n=1 Tax=Lottia gigantea TaxID=225164 RepID=V3ZSP5_LOTGI|nr:hypothetical protein LOTGIDRAFT_155087 [Lottia gigantea]ESO85600.1 hypothetical protein LOTGIDRAFT_155087 [Lottia gigantea]